MRFLIDVCVGRVVEQDICSSLPFDFKCVRDIDPRMADSDIMRLARQEQRIIITSDKDFGEMVYRQGMTHHGVLLLRVDELTMAQKVDVLTKVLTEHGSLLTGHFCVYQGDLLRVR
jgi:predicted nuclease of predicted toxin-antitoxin system